MSLSHCKSFVLTMLLVLFVGGVVIAKKPPKDPPPPEPDPVPIEYQLTWVDGLDVSNPDFQTSVFALNDSGLAVGRAKTLFDDGTYTQQAFRWTKHTGMVWLDELSDTWTDLNTNQPATGWTANTATDVNEIGQIVGYADKEGEDARAFVFDDAFGFYLLPTVDGPGPHLAYSINDAGDVLGEYRVNGDWYDSELFFWTALKPSEITLLLPGLTVRSHVLGDSHFSCTVSDGAQLGDIDYKLYSYTVQSDGTLVYQLASELDNVWHIGIMSRNSKVPFKEEYTSRVKIRGRWTTVTEYSVGIYDGNTNQSTMVAPAGFSYHVGEANTSGDFLFASEDAKQKIYRHEEDAVYNLYDLLDESSKAQLDEFGMVGSFRPRINNSNAAGLSATDRYDHIASMYNYANGDGYMRYRAFILTPVELP